MRYGPLSRKQKTAMLWWCSPGSEDFDAIICDGAIRSGKTLSLTVGFVMWSMTSFDGQIFAMCGKTIESLRRNVTNLMPQWLGGAFEITEKRTEHCLRIRRGEVENTYYLFGGRDESSFAHIQGITLAGALLDEVALMPRSFVEQTIARCSVAGSRLFFSCNPDTPGHWFYQEWIRKAEISREDIAREIYDLLARTIVRMLRAGSRETGITRALVTGGVASSPLLRQLLEERRQKTNGCPEMVFGKPERSGDNAVGVALIGVKRLERTSQEEISSHGR